MLAPVPVFAFRAAENLDDGVVLTALGFLAVVALAGWAGYPEQPP